MSKIIENLYRAVQVLFILAYRENERRWPYGAIVALAQILTTLLLILLLPYIILKLFLNLVSPKDAEEALNEISRLLAIYQETSEYEWRSARQIRLRVLERHKDSALSQEVVKQSQVVPQLLAYEGQLFRIRLEDEDEFVERRLAEIVETRASAKALSGEEEERLRENLSQQFDLIEEHAGDDLRKGFYLGREIMAAKINIGQEQTPPREDFSEAPT